MLRIILGRAGTGKTSVIYEEMRRLTLEGNGGFVLLVPEQYSHNAERQLCAACGDSLSLYGEVLSFTRLCSRVFSQTGGSARRFIDAAGKTLVMSRALTASAPFLKVYGSRIKKTDFISSLVETSTEFRRAAVSPEQLASAAQRVEGTLSNKLSDLALIFDTYDALMRDIASDPDERLEVLARVIGQSSYGAGRRYYIDGFTDFTALQLGVISKLMTGNDLTVCLTCDDMYGDDELFFSARTTARALLRMAEESGTHASVEIREAADSGPLRFLEQELFGAGAVRYEGDTGGSIALAAGASPADELHFAAAEIKRLVSGGYRWRDIAVACTQWDSISSLCRNIMSRYEIPVYINDKTDIRLLPPVSFMLSALRVITTGWEYEAVFGYLKTGVTSIPRADIDIIENYVLKWSIRGKMWYSDDDWVMDPGGYRQEMSERDAEMLEHINDIRRSVADPLYALQRDLERGGTYGEMLRSLFEFISASGLSSTIDARAEDFEKAGDRQQYNVYSSLWDTIVTAMEQFNDVIGDVPATVEEFASHWELVLSQYDMGAIPPVADAVSCGDIARMLSRNVKCIIVAGASDNSLPRMSAAAGALSEYEREELIKLDLPIPSSRQKRMADDVYAVYASLVQASDRIVMTYSDTSPSGAQERPSMYFTRISDMFGLIPERIDRRDCKMFSLNTVMELASSAYAEPSDPAACAARRFAERDEELSAALDTAVRASQLKRGSLAPDTARRLYGGKVSLTASRVEKYYSCRFSYFMRYGLKAEPRTKAALDAPVIGTYMHFILENVTREVGKLGGFSQVSDEQLRALASRYTAEYSSKVLLGYDGKSGRFKYLFRRLAEDAELVVLQMAQELRSSDFAPLDFELSFARDGDMVPPEITDGDVTVRVNGIVDRVDGWVHDDKLYLRVVDYKTGRKTFSLSDVWYGMGIQMLIYLFALQDRGAERYGREIIPAGVLYAPAREVFIPASPHVSDAELEKERTKNVRRSGLLLDDPAVIEAMERGGKGRYMPVKFTKGGAPTGDSVANAEQLGKLARHIDKLLIGIGRELNNGSILADPYYKSQMDNACLYCEYKNACRFDESGDERPHYISKLPTPKAWDRIAGEGRN